MWDECRASSKSTLVDPKCKGSMYISIPPHGPAKSTSDDINVHSFSVIFYIIIWLMHCPLVISECVNHFCHHGPLTRYVQVWVAHAPGMPGTFSPSPTSKESTSMLSRHASRHVRDARAVMHVGIANPRWWGKRSQHSRRMRNPQFYVSGKRPIAVCPMQIH